MTKANITQYSSTPSSNADINDINIAENCPASGLNNAIRELMAHLKNVDTGSQALTALSVAGSVTATTSLKTPLIEFTDGDNALTISDGGNVTANANLTVSGDLIAPSLNGGQFAVNNMIINGNMAINQRGVTSGVTSGYFVDRFSLSGCSASAVITSSTPTQFPTAITVSATSGNPIISQRIESKNVQHLSGKVVTASFFAKNISNATTLYASLQYAGSADNFGSTTTISEQNLGTLTTDWVKYTASWTVPSGGLNGLALNILCAGSGTFTMGVTGVMLQEGSVATSFQHRSFGEELALCQRYFNSSYAYGTAIGSETGSNGEVTPIGHMSIGGSYNILGQWIQPTPMRSSPTIVIYNPVTGTVDSFRGDGSNYSGARFLNTNEKGTTFYIHATSVGATVFVRIHATFDSEL